MVIIMNQFEKDISKARETAQLVSHYGGRAYFVGGYVRDLFMGRKNKDIDIEIHGISEADIGKILMSLGKVMEIGKSFGIYGLKGYNLDIALPRRERATGKGHRDFDVEVNSHLGTLNAAMRRDFTINALMQDILTGEIIDHFGGRSDLEKGIIRHVNNKSFSEDPLRVLRAAQFAARFSFAVSEDTIKLCRNIDLTALPKERILSELSKALLKSDRPSVFFEVLRSMDKLDDYFPELKELIGIEQNPVHHAEGDAWTHTMMVLDEAASLKDKTQNPLWFMLSALCHDFGKAVTTQSIDGVIHAYGHETAGLPIAERFIKRLTNETALIRYVLSLCEYHMKPRVLYKNNSSVKSTNKMFDSVADTAGLIYIAEADNRGKLPRETDEAGLSFLLEREQIYLKTMEKPHVTGKDLIDAGLVPDEVFKDILGYAHKLRLALVPKEEALKQTLAYARKFKK